MTKAHRHHDVKRYPLPAALMDPAFLACVHQVADTPEVLEQFDRLYGADLCGRRSPIERMVDVAAGKAHQDMSAFVGFVHRGVYMALPDDVISALRIAADAATAATGA